MRFYIFSILFIRSIARYELFSTIVITNAINVIPFFCFFTLSLVLSLLIIENRIDTKKRTMAEVIFGACMGVLIVLLVYSLTIFKQA